mmetsp:Transcript_27428/g.44640  ORF Transcript_27428/g.44640 Transcript_27428/m.44640 type:complete len:104 (-) Transcript_27428:461-772(-)
MIIQSPEPTTHNALTAPTAHPRVPVSNSSNIDTFDSKYSVWRNIFAKNCKDVNQYMSVAKAVTPLIRANPHIVPSSMGRRPNRSAARLRRMANKTPRRMMAIT